MMLLLTGNLVFAETSDKKPQESFSFNLSDLGQAVNTFSLDNVMANYAANPSNVNFQLPSMSLPIVVMPNTAPTEPMKMPPVMPNLPMPQLPINPLQNMPAQPVRTMDLPAPKQDFYSRNLSPQLPEPALGGNTSVQDFFEDAKNKAQAPDQWADNQNN